MKTLNKLILVISFISITLVGNAQSVGIGTETPDNGAILDIVSSDKGLLIPRLDTANVSAPKLGMMVLLVGTSDLYTYNGNRWEILGKEIHEILDVDKDTKVHFSEGITDDTLKVMINGNNKLYFRSDGAGRSRIEFPSNNANAAVGGRALQSNTTGWYNSAFGTQSLTSNSTGSSNVGIGSASLANNTTGSQNTGIGYFALLENINGFSNVGVGVSALKSNTTGDYNVAIGAASNQNNTGGDGNVSIGNLALGSNVTSNNNVAVGRSALRSNTAGSGNVSLGAYSGYYETGSNKLYIANTTADSYSALIYGEFDNSFLRLNGEIFLRDGMVDSDRDTKLYFEELSSEDNLKLMINNEDKFSFKSNGSGTTRIEFLSNNSNNAIGIDALKSNTLGAHNVAFGDSSLSNNSTGAYNVAIGYQALLENTIGVENVAVGPLALSNNISGLNNVVVGFAALRNNTTGNRNVAIGAYSNQRNTTGTYNISLGAQSLLNNLTGSRNVVLGYNALLYNTSGTGNIALGHSAGYFESGSNKLYIENSGEDKIGALIYGEFDNDFIRLNGEVLIRDGIKGNTDVNGNLDINGDLFIRDGITGNTDVNGNLDINGDLFIRDGITGNLDISGNSTTDGIVSIGGSHGERARLEVHGSGPFDLYLTAAYYNAAANSGVYTGNREVTAWFEKHVAAKEFQAFSDARIKNIKGVSDSRKDLNTLAEIEITDYKYIDSIGSGNQEYKKVIAQQVKKVYPQAVSANIKDFVPNIYQLAEIKDGWMSIPVQTDIGDKIKLILKDGDKIVQVVESTEQGIRLDIDQEGEVFVYGTEVDDFHTVDYEALSMLNISATQELIKQIASQEKRINDLEGKVIKLLEVMVE